QEAVFCGLATGYLTSVMKTLRNNSPECMPGVFRRFSATSAWTGFWHGGDFNFDSQGRHWQLAGINTVVTRANFPPDTPDTFWGKSDIAVMEFFTKELANPRANNDENFSLDIKAQSKLQAHLILTTTNHADWGL